MRKTRIFTLARIVNLFVFVVCCAIVNFIFNSHIVFLFTVLAIVIFLFQFFAGPSIEDEKRRKFYEDQERWRLVQTRAEAQWEADRLHLAKALAFELHKLQMQERAQAQEKAQL